MKAIIATFITMALLSSILCKSYDLVNGTQLLVSKLKAKEKYIFYIEAIQCYEVTFNLATKFTGNIMTLFDIYMYIYEFSSRSSSSYLNKKYYPFIPNYKGNEITDHLDYLIIREDTKFLAIEIIPDYDIDYMKITADLEIVGYALDNGVTKSTNLLKKGYPFYLLIKSSESQIDLFKITTYKERISPSYVYEYDEKVYLREDSTKYFEYSYVGDNIVASLDYSVKQNNTQYVALKLTPNNDIKINVTVDVVVGAYDLSKNVSEKVNNLRAGYSYYFLIPSTIYSSQTINITMNDMDTQPFSSLNIHELSKRYLGKSTYYKSQKIITTKKGDELFASFIYVTTKYDTQYITFEIHPSCAFSIILFNEYLFSVSFLNHVLIFLSKEQVTKLFSSLTLT